MKSIFLAVQFIFFLIVLQLLHGCATAPRANRAIGQMYQGNHLQAWKMVSAEIDRPTVSSREGLCENHVAALQILQNIITYDFAPSDPDLFAQKSYEYVHENCKEFPRKIQTAENNIGLYYQNTRRPGKAIPYFNRALELSPAGTYNHLINLNNLASCYADMGKFDIRDHYRVEAITEGQKYFKKRRKYRFNLEEFNEWNNYFKILSYRVGDLSWAKGENRLSEMKSIWNEMEEINRRWYSTQTQYIAYTQTSQHFSSAGDPQFARNLIETARRLSQKYPYNNPAAVDLDLQLAEAKAYEAENNWRKSAEIFKSWIDNYERVSGKSLQGNDYRLAGLAQEGAADYDQARTYYGKSIVEFENMRSTFNVRTRTQFLSGLIITPYWGLIRSNAILYGMLGDEKYFQEALQAARMLRARQFGEMIGMEFRNEDSLAVTQKNLRPGELLINYIVSDRAVVVFAISNNSKDLIILPVPQEEFNIVMQEARRFISAPGDTESAAQALLIASGIAVKPVAHLVGSYRKLIIIPDGMLNGVPYSLLSQSLERYSPLIADHEISYSPSISFLIEERKGGRQRAAAGLFALADPEYGARSAPESYNGGAKSFYTRAVENFNLFAPLPETRIEVDNIKRFFPGEEVTTVLGDEALESRIKTIHLAHYRYLHFATHGILGNQIPGIDEPALVLSREPNGSSQDGFLTLSEVQDLSLNSELTVLSACDTGSGKYFTGEGVMGLSRGFLIAGSRAVLVSLWPVASEATVQLMTEFYRYLRSGHTKAESLRLAQLSIMEGHAPDLQAARGIEMVIKQTGRQKKHPYFWSPFILIGE